jgi:hypothetical protein
MWLRFSGGVVGCGPAARPPPRPTAARRSSANAAAVLPGESDPEAAEEGKLAEAAVEARHPAHAVAANLEFHPAGVLGVKVGHMEQVLDPAGAQHRKLLLVLGRGLAVALANRCRLEGREGVDAAARFQVP